MSQRAGVPRYGTRHHRLQQQTPEPRIPPPPLLPQAMTDIINNLPPPAEWPSKVLSYVVVDPLLALAGLFLDIVISPRTHRFVLRIGVLSAIFWTAFGLALAAYVGFYRAWVPSIGVQTDVWLQYGFESPPFADVSLRSNDGLRSIFAEDQEYDVSLDLVVPLSAANIDLGNFMVSIDLVSPQNQTIHHVSKPTIIVHESAPVRAMNNLAFQLTRSTPALLMPSSSLPVQLISIPLFRRSVLQPLNSALPFGALASASVTRAHISVGRQDSLKYWMYGGGHGVGGVLKESGGILKAAAGGEGFRSRGELQTHGASLRFDAHLKGLRYFMYHHPLASFLVFTALFMSFELLSALTLWALAALYTSSLTQPSLAVENNYMGRGLQDNSNDSDTTTRGNRRRTRGVEEGEDEEEEEEDSDTITGPESEVEGNAQSQSQASLRARDAQERYEARQAEILRDEAEGRRMTAVDAPSQGSGLDDLELVTQGRRVLGRLDEETEEETDVALSEASIGWEDVGGEETEQGIYGEEQQQGEGGNGLRRRRRGDDDESYRDSTVGTSRAPSSAPSYGGTSLASFAGRAVSSTAPSTVYSRSQTEATPEIKQEEDLTPDAESSD
ncbi:hypothetical protein CBS101457_001161 [Exobasidium rhododendri]|nr:hypothetical protein CBS101457_001161 [Exobasidium rhododendri]